MDWSNERYVRIYTRDTKHWLQFGWQGQTLLMMILRKCDRAGRIDGIEDPAQDLALVTGLPVDVVEEGLSRLMRTPMHEEQSTVIIDSGVLIIPNFLEAQETASSDAERQRKSREKRRLDALGSSKVIAMSEQKPKERRATALPADWAPNDAHRALAIEKGVRCDDESVKFRDYCSAKGVKYKDHDAAFRNWLRNAAQYSRTSSVGGPYGLKGLEED